MLKTANDINNLSLSSLIDITANVHIDANFAVHHPQYQPFALPKPLATRFQKNPPKIQHQYLAILLRNFIYGIYYNGYLKRSLALDSKTVNSSEMQMIENHSVLDVDWVFYEQLQANNHGKGYFEDNWQVLSIEPDGGMTVTKGDMAVYVEADCHLQSQSKSVRVGDSVGIWMPKNRLQQGYYLAISNLESQKLTTLHTNLSTSKIYFNFTSPGAIMCMDGLTEHLNAANVPFRFKVFYNPKAYLRFDSGVMHFQSSDYPVIRQVIQPIYRAYKSYFHQEIPLFTKFLAPGLGLAEVPNFHGTQQSFGMNRCQILANALLEVWQGGINTIDERMNAIKKHFTNHSIDLQFPYLNPHADDIYQPLN